jgi:hypothetical protein
VSSHTYRTFVHVLPALIWLFMAIGVLASCAKLLELAVTIGVVATIKSDLNILWVLPLAFILPAFFLAFLVTHYPNIKVYEEGLEIQYLIFWLFMPWEDVLGIRTELFGGSRTVVVKKLPPFTILPSIGRYHELIHTIRERANLSEDD